MAISTMPPFPIFFDAAGNPLEAGQIFIGVAGLDPESNPIPTYWDAALTQLAPQPIRTSGGYMVRAGTPAVVYVDAADCSMTVRDRNGVFIYNSPNVLLRIGGVELGGPIISADNVSFIAAGSGAIVRTVTSKLRDFVSVKDFGAVGDQVTDDTPAFLAAIAAAKTIYVPEPTIGYRITSKLILPNETALFGFNSERTRIVRTGNFVLFEMQTESSISGLNIDDLSVSYTSNTIEILGTTSGQYIHNCKFVNSPGAGSFIFFDVNAGSDFKLSDCTATAKIGTNRAVRFSTVGAGSFQRRTFTNFVTNGNGFDFGDAVGVEISGSIFGSSVFTSNTSRVGIVGCEQVSISTLSGSRNRIVGSSLVTDLTLSSGTTDCVVTGNTTQAGIDIINSSGNSTNLLEQKTTSYNPDFKSGATPVNLGTGGAQSGSFSLDGAVCHFSAILQLGTGGGFLTSDEIVFNLPHRAVLSSPSSFPATPSTSWPGFVARISTKVGGGTAFLPMYPYLLSSGVESGLVFYTFSATPSLVVADLVFPGFFNGDFIEINGTFTLG